LAAIKSTFWESNSIIDFILRYEELYPATVSYTVYKGDGFTHLLVGNEHVLVEDYRTGTFTMYSDTNYNHDGISDTGWSYSEERIVMLNTSKEETDDFFEKRGLAANVATVDYSDFYIDGKFSHIVAWDFITTPAYMDQIEGFYSWFDRGMSFLFTDKTYLRLFMAEFRACEKTFTTSVPFDEAKAVYIDAISLSCPNDYSQIRVSGTLCTKGVYRIMSGNNTYFVPEYVFADLISLSAFTEFNAPYTNHTLSEGKNMTVDDLRTIFEGGLSSDEFSPFAHRTLLSYTKNKQRLLFPVYEGEEQIGYAYISIDKEGNVNHLTLFDTDYRYIAFPAIDGLPEGEWIYKGHIQFKAD
jgi:hypothetical protein